MRSANMRLGPIRISADDLPRLDFRIEKSLVELRIRILRHGVTESWMVNCGRYATGKRPNESGNKMTAAMDTWKIAWHEYECRI